MFTFLVSISLVMVGFGAALHALLNKHDSRSALAWVAVCLMLPALGSIAYLIFGINRAKVRGQRVYLAGLDEGACETSNDCHRDLFRPLSLVGENVTGQGLRSCEDVQLLENGEALFPKMLEDINSAKHRIYFSTYIFQNDKIGNEFLEAILAAKSRAVDVKVIIDGLGAIAYPPSISKILRKNGIDVKQFNPIRLLPPAFHINMRNHRKILIVDGELAYTGGQNVSSRHLVEEKSNRKKTKDLHFRLTGKIVDDIEKAFLKDWNYCCESTRLITFSPVNSACADSKIWTRIILDGPNENLDKLNELLVGIFSAAKERIWIMTPYFLPGLDLIGALNGARLRGVDVKILIPMQTNIRLASWAVQHNLQFIVSKGFAVYLQPPPFVHTKAILVDNNYSLIGSANLDPRSLRLNFELGVEIFSEDFNADISRYFDKQLKSSVQFDEDQVSARSRLSRIRDAVAWLFSPYL